MAEMESISTRLDELSSRLDSFERRLSAGAIGGQVRPHGGSGLSYCSVPEVDEPSFGPEVSMERASLIRVMSKKWVNGTQLHYYFFEGQPWGTNDAEKSVVRRGFRVWEDLDIGVSFSEVTSREDAEIRIGFLRGDGAWSNVGRDILNKGLNERTMNFGWDLTRSAREIDTSVHEIGHTLGFPHEHQNPNAGIVWNEEAVYRELAGWPNYWPREQTWWNIIRKIPPDTIQGSTWDPNSIMHYEFGAGLIEEPEQYRGGLRPDAGLSEKDINQARFFYPPLEPALPELRPFHSELLSIGPGEQRNFEVNPTFRRYYNFRTFGESDTVMVLFEERDNELRYVTGADDSGTDLNASFRVRLSADRKYVLRIRLYFNYSSGDTAVMMW